MVNKSKKLSLASIISFLALAIYSAPAFAVTLTNPLEGVMGQNAGPEQIPDYIGKLIGGIFGVVGALALVMFVYGGLMWMLSGGNQERVKKGRDILIWATVGIVVIFSSYVILSFILGAIGGGEVDVSGSPVAASQL